jgi:16S rRNA (cytosine1402-N4)-methyltransferase
MEDIKAHRSVMLAESIELLQPAKGKWLIDATFGSGGHTAALLEKGANVVAFDWDADSIERGSVKFVKELETGRLVLVHASFADLAKEWKKIADGKQLSGILFDFGTSTEQLMSEDRGFSFTGDGPLDMRMDTRRGVTAADMLTFLTEGQLVGIFQNYGGEEESRKIARRIKQSMPVTTTSQLAEIVSKAKRKPTRKTHPATKVFQALRIAVNTELDEITEALPAALELLPAGGRIVTISFHDGEDRIVKQLFRAWAQEEKVDLLMKKPLAPSPEEIEVNLRARSAKLRALKKK